MIERILVASLVVVVGVLAFLLFRQAHLRRASAVTTAADRPAIVYFRSDACVPCVAQAHFLQQLQSSFEHAFALEKVDADTEPAKAESYGIFTLPTTLVVDRSGQVRYANYGLADPRKLAGQLRALEAVGNGSGYHRISG